MQKVIAFITRAREKFQEARKAVVPLVAALALIIGVDAPLYQDVVAILVALGVYAVPNQDKATK